MTHSRALLGMAVLVMACAGCGLIQTSRLHTAAARGDLAAVSYSLDSGVYVDSRDSESSTALHQAAAAGSRAVVLLLLTRGADVNAHNILGITPLHAAANSGHADVIQALLDYGATIDAKTTFLGATPLHYATDQGHIAAVRALLVRGAAPDVPDLRGVTPIDHAARKGYGRILELLQTGQRHAPGK